MKTGVLWTIVIAAIVIIAAGVYFYQGAYPPASPSSSSQTPSNSAPASSSGANTEAITISNFAFDPATITIKTGDTVTWTNEDSVQHTITSDSGSELSASPISTSQTYSHTFNIPGTYAYHCNIHKTMTGTVIVQ